MNSQHKKTNSKGDLALKNRFERFPVYKTNSESKLYIKTYFFSKPMNKKL